ncbi:heme A synthase [Aquibacillus sp. 3ASR75-11]|uniref:Heme A synthase n=1 Tax=Terrihalobacillus insolitus TaxID=2950438 RepID=A0A9X4AMQ4_9BACI|nr:heme A synthase [Terrihalobacillus insolitus]MDC3412795.1 heme A synthase [Terrihalobacillus insolitus]MDC3423728.1 heme A synthase [Terrihalobacillus insolitus]
MNKLLKTISILATFGMLLVLVGGALVTKTESGMGCGSSWPLCDGEIIPSVITPELIIELSHRLVSGAVGILVLLLSVLSWKFIGHIREVKLLSFTSLFFLVLQALIGAAAVMWGQSDFVLAMHFGISLISFASIFLLTLLIFEIDKKFDARSLVIEPKLRMQIYALTAYILVVVYTGAFVRYADASMTCGSWPLCSSTTPFSDLYFGQWIQMGHRFAAGIAFVWTVLLFFKIIKSYKGNRVMLIGWTAALILMILQVTLGAMIIFTMLNLYIALLHALVITCYFGVLSYFVLLSTRSAKYEKERAESE